LPTGNFLEWLGSAHDFSDWMSVFLMSAIKRRGITGSGKPCGTRHHRRNIALHQKAIDWLQRENATFVVVVDNFAEAF